MNKRPRNEFQIQERKRFFLHETSALLVSKGYDVQLIYDKCDPVPIGFSISSHKVEVSLSKVFGNYNRLWCKISYVGPSVFNDKIFFEPLKSGFDIELSVSRIIEFCKNVSPEIEFLRRIDECFSSLANTLGKEYIGKSFEYNGILVSKLDTGDVLLGIRIPLDDATSMAIVSIYDVIEPILKK